MKSLSIPSFSFVKVLIYWNKKQQLQQCVQVFITAGMVVYL